MPCSINKNVIKVACSCNLTYKVLHFTYKVTWHFIILLYIYQ